MDVDEGTNFHHNDLIVLDLASSFSNVEIYDFGRILNTDFVLTERTYLEKCLKKKAVKSCTNHFFGAGTETISIETVPYSSTMSASCFSDVSRLSMQLKSCTNSFFNENIVQFFTSTTTVLATFNQLTNDYTLHDDSGTINFKTNDKNEVIVFDNMIAFKRIFESNECKIPTTLSTKFLKYSFDEKHYYSFENADKLYLSADLCSISCDKMHYLVIKDSGIYQIPNNFNLTGIKKCEENNSLSFEIHNENNIENMIVSDLYRVSTIMNELLVNKTKINYLDFQLFVPFSVGIHRIFYYDNHNVIKTKHSLVDKCIVNTVSKTYHCDTFEKDKSIAIRELFTECLSGLLCGPNGIVFDSNFTKIIANVSDNYQQLSQLNVPVGQFDSTVNMSIMNHQNNLVKHDLDILISFNDTEDYTWLSRKGEEMWNSMVNTWDYVSNFGAKYKFYIEIFVGSLLVLIVLRFFGFGCIMSCCRLCCKCTKHKRKGRNGRRGSFESNGSGDEDIEMGIIN